MNTQSEMLSALANRRHGHTLPRKFYTDPAFYQLDLETLFYREWLFVGHDCELAEPGDYFTLQVGDYPIVVVRGRDGVIRAFHNSCRHRGSRICSAERGSAVRLVCPYHNWSYDLDGRLLFARDMGKGFDPKPLGLKPVHCESVGGYLWICLAPDAARLRGVPRQGRALSRAASADRGQGRLRKHDRRERQLEAGLGKQSRMLSLRAATIPNSAAPSPKRRRSPASRAR